jgi:hypothetical protein
MKQDHRKGCVIDPAYVNKIANDYLEELIWAYFMT